MDGYVYRRDLLDAARLRELTRRDDAAGLIRIAAHLAAIAITGGLALVAAGTWWVLAAWTLHGVILTFVFAPLHETIHRTAFRSKWLNDLVASVTGFVLLLPARYFRRFHFAHHRHTNLANEDPELQFSKPKSRLEYAWAMTGLGSYWWPRSKATVLHAAGRVNENFIPVSARKEVIVEARIHVALYVALVAISIALESTLLLHLWLAPVLIGMVALRCFLLAEHAGCELSDDMLANTRTTISNPVVRLLTWNMPYHCEHHLFPSVPFHQLPDLHEKVKHHVVHVSPGYLAFHAELLRSLPFALKRNGR